MKKANKSADAFEHSGRPIPTNIKNSELIDARRAQIISGAIKLFREKDFHQTTVREIAEASGLTMGTMYNYVRSKADIIYIVYQHMNKILATDLKRSMDSVTDPKDKLRAAIKQNIETIYLHHDIILFLYTEGSCYDRKSLHSVLSQETKYIELFEELLRQSFVDENIHECRLKLTADLLSFIPIILTFRRWSLKRRFKSMEVVISELMNFIEFSIDFIKANKKK